MLTVQVQGMLGGRCECEYKIDSEFTLNTIGLLADFPLFGYIQMHKNSLLIIHMEMRMWYEPLSPSEW